MSSVLTQFDWIQQDLPSTAIQFVVHGIPQPRGSKITQVMYDRVTGDPVIDENGRVKTYMRDANKKSGPWMKLVAEYARVCMSYRDLLEGPVLLGAQFYFQRPQSHLGTGRNAGKLRGSAPVEHANVPDLTKILRAVEDAMTGIVYEDDRKIVRYIENTGKNWCLRDPRVEIVVMPAQ